MSEARQNSKRRVLRVASLFSGIGGFELGFRDSGMDPALFCDVDPHAKAVIGAEWPNVPFCDDVRDLEALPDVEVVTAGFPCQDLSQAGRKAGITGDRSGLVDHLFRLLETASPSLEWVVVENVPYMLGLDKGFAMRSLIDRFEALGYRWAYRVVDSRAFGIPQRRHRVLLVASKSGYPVHVLGGDADGGLVDQKPAIVDYDASYGFYWTEGNRGLGWVKNGVPPVKGGSGLGIPSPPAIWVPRTGQLGKPTIADAERLQGFPAGWTEAVAAVGARVGARWKLVGNAVNVATARWLGTRLASPILSTVNYDPRDTFDAHKRWPNAAMGENGRRARLSLTPWPEMMPSTPISDFLTEPLVPLSQKAALGFLNRALTTPKLVYSDFFLDSVRAYCGLGASYDPPAPMKIAS
jgi:DNA (cytosine-5)-methyltransferase 1